MGMYTEVFINTDLKEGVPVDVINLLKAICACDFESEYLKDKPVCWAGLFSNGSYYTPYTECAKLTFDQTSEQWSIIGKGDIKNVGEIQQFFEFIRPHCEGEFIGYYRHENSREPTLIYADNE